MISKPIRIQRMRAKGWIMPPNTIYVGRGSRWGNPFPIGKEGPLGRIAPDNLGAVGMFEDMLVDPEMRQITGYPSDLSELRGKNLACWCGLNHPCHADVLLEMANR